MPTETRNLSAEEHDDYCGLLYAAARLEGALHVHYVTAIVPQDGATGFMHCNSLGEAAEVAYAALRKPHKLVAVYLFGNGNVRLVQDMTGARMPDA